MKNWKNIFAVIGAMAAAPFAVSQEAPAPEAAPAPAAPAAEATVPAALQPGTAETYEFDSKYGIIYVERSLVDGVPAFRTTIRGVHVAATVNEVIRTMMAAQEPLIAEFPVESVVPNPQAAGMVPTSVGSVSSNYEYMGGKFMVTSSVSGVPAGVTAVDLVNEIMPAMAEIIASQPISITGKTISIGGAMAPGTAPSFTIFVDNDQTRSPNNPPIDRTLDIDDLVITQ